MDREFTSKRLYSAASSDLQQSLPTAPSVHEAARGRTGGTSSAGLLLLSLGIWAAVWAALASLSSWFH